MWYPITACLLCLLLLLPAPGQQKSSTKFDLSIDHIMRGPGLYGYPPQFARWSGDSQKVFFRWKRHGEAVNKEYSTYVVNRDGSGLRRLSEEEEKEAPPIMGDDTHDWKLTVYSSEGDIFLYDQMAVRRHRLTRTSDIEANPRFTQDEQRITFVRSNNLYVLSPRDGSIEQLTDIRAAGAEPGAASAAIAGGGGGRRGGFAAGGVASTSDDEERKGTESQEFLKKEERELLEYVREQARKRDEDRAKRRKENPRKTFRLAARQTVGGILLSGDESYAVVSLLESAEASKNTIVPNFITDTAYTTDISSRAKVGDTQSRMRLAILNTKTGESKFVDPGFKERDVRLGRPMFSEDGTKLIVSGRSADNKDSWIFAVDPVAASTRTLAAMHDDAWVDGPAGFATGWLKDNKTVYFTSEKDGWSHLYSVPFEGGEARQLTSGKWEVREVALTPDRSQFLLTTSEVNAGEEHLYRMSVEGGAREKLTRGPGGHAAKLSPDGTMLATIHSYTNKPPELYLQDLKGGATKQVTTSPAPEFSSYPWLDVPTIEIPARDGAKIPAHVFKPANWRKGGPLVVFVHGAGYLQNVHRKWTYYAQSYLFHHLLRERGYMVLNIDYRASAGYGRDWRTAIYRHMGGKDLDDHVDAVKWAITEHGVDPKRVGIYGGSYGGFITLMALFTQPDVFAAGAALRPVTDWAHYNHGYTSNILNIPQKDAEAYRQSSPIYHAKGLKGALLICHGMVDTNVHFQDTVRLVQRLIELRKENWELAVYPVEDHGFLQPTSWADEYKRIFKLFETSLRL